MMMRRRSRLSSGVLFVVLGATVSMAGTASAQQSQAPVPSVGFGALTASVSAAPATSAGGIQELTVGWSAFAAPAGQLLPQGAPLTPVNRFTVAAQRAAEGPMPRERNPELSADQLVVVGAGANGAPLSWSLIKDPRIVRAEQPGADGALTGQVLVRSDTQLLVVVPDSPQVTQVGIYQPRWNGTAWILDLLGSFAIGQAR